MNHAEILADVKKAQEYLRRPDLTGHIGMACEYLDLVEAMLTTAVQLEESQINQCPFCGHIGLNQKDQWQMWIKVDGDLFNLDYADTIEISQAVGSWRVRACQRGHNEKIPLLEKVSKDEAERYLDALLERLGGFNAEDVVKHKSVCESRGFHVWKAQGIVERCVDCGQFRGVEETKRDCESTFGTPLSLTEARRAAEGMRRSKTVDTQYWPWVIEELCRMVEAKETEGVR